MQKRPITKFRPGLERLEAKLPLSVSPTTAPIVNQKAGPEALASQKAEGDTSSHADAAASVSPAAVKPNFGFLVYRITNPNPFNTKMVPPFGHVLVQAAQPVPGQVYNVLSVVVRNGTAQTFNASSGFTVRIPGQQQATPILTGDQQWLPGQRIVFYILTKKYYPLKSQVTTGFVFDLGGAKSTAIPGPSGIFLRLKYNPATIGNTLDAIVAYGQGAEGGAGPKTGIADTQIFEFVSSKTERNDFGGYF